MRVIFAGSSRTIGRSGFWHDLGIRDCLFSYYELAKAKDGDLEEFVEKGVWPIKHKEIPDDFKNRQYTTTRRLALLSRLKDGSEVKNQRWRVMLDSGAFSAWTRREQIDIDEYCEYIERNQRLIDSYITLDVIPGIKNQKRTVKQVEESAELSRDNFLYMKSKGLNPIPVYHWGEDPKWLKLMLEDNEPYICIGVPGVSREALVPWLDRVFTILTDRCGEPLTSVHGLGVFKPHLLFRYPWYCMTEENHQVLTKGGWKGRSDILIGEEILCFDKGRVYWSPIISIPSFQVVDELMYKIENRNFFAMVTPNHRWILQNIENKKWNDCETEELVDCNKRGQAQGRRRCVVTSRMGIPRVGNYDGPVIKTIPDYLVELMAWYWTEGSIRKRSRYRTDSIAIYQSVKANPTKVERIRRVLKEAKEAYCESFSESDQCVQFELYGKARDYLLEVSPNKEIQYSWLWQLTQDQLKLFIEVSILGDGSRRDGNFSIAQAISVNIDSFRVACLLAGIPTSTYVTRSSAGGSNCQGDGSTYGINSSPVQIIHPNELRHKEVRYSGVVWCVSVESGAFFVKSREKIYVTGNSVDATSWLMQAAAGRIMVPPIRNGVSAFEKPPIMIHVSFSGKPCGVEAYDTQGSLVREAVDTFLGECGLTLQEVRVHFVPRMKACAYYFHRLGLELEGRKFEYRCRGQLV